MEVQDSTPQNGVSTEAEHSSMATSEINEGSDTSSFCMVEKGDEEEGIKMSTESQDFNSANVGESVENNTPEMPGNVPDENVAQEPEISNKLSDENITDEAEISNKIPDENITDEAEISNKIPDENKVTEEAEISSKLSKVEITSEPEITSNISDKKVANDEPLVIIVAGKVGSGKSTALNNIFGLNLKVESSPTAVTDTIKVEEVVKNGITVRIIDTPGLGAVKLDTRSIADQMASATNGKNFLLLYCLAVRPSDILTETDRNIVKNLHEALGVQVWKKCVVLLTFSDLVRRDEFPTSNKNKEYIEFLKEHAQQFQKILQDETMVEIEVKTIFDYMSRKVREGEKTSDAVIAIPVRKEIVNEPDTLPGVLVDDKLDWTGIVFIELMKRRDAKERVLPLIVKTGQVVTKFPVRKLLAGGSLGILVGAGIGAVGGIPLGPIGMAAGAAIGAVVGGTVGLPMYKVVDILRNQSK